MRKSSVALDSSKNLQVRVFWGDVLYDTVICRPNESVTVGNTPGNTFIMDAGKSLKLVELKSGNVAELQFSDDVDGHISVGKELMSLKKAISSKHVVKNPDGFYHARLADNDKADFIIGHVSFYLSWIGHTKPLPKGLLFGDRKKMIWIAGVCSLVVVLISLLALWEPPPPEKPPERLVMLTPRNAPAKAAMGEAKSADGGAQKGESGKAEQVAPEKPSMASILKSANLGSLVSGLTSLGANAPSTAANPATTSAVPQAGNGGLGTEGLKTGAGGKTVGIGRTVGQGEGGFEGTGRLGLSGNSAVEGSSGHGEGSSTTGGGLDREVIESIIRRRLDRIRLCYERQLNFNPKLVGKVTVHFVIGRKGEVLSSRATEDTMKNESVRSCILAEVGSWTFPTPEGGTLVNVDYPFVFESSAKGP